MAFFFQLLSVFMMSILILCHPLQRWHAKDNDHSYTFIETNFFSTLWPSSWSSPPAQTMPCPRGTHGERLVMSERRMCCLLSCSLEYFAVLPPTSLSVWLASNKSVRALSKIYEMVISSFPKDLLSLPIPKLPSGSSLLLGRALFAMTLLW